MKKYQFVEPHITGGDAVVTITEDKVVQYMRSMYPSSLSDLPDKELIDDFCIIHWAEEIE